MTSLAKSCVSKFQCRYICLSTVHWRRKPKPERDMSRRNFEGEVLKERLRRREEDIKAQQPYKDGVFAVVQRFKAELDEIERQKHDVQGEQMKREMAEREQAAKNLTIIAKSNEDLRRQREMHKLILEDEERRKLTEKLQERQLEKEEQKRRSTEIVLRLIEEVQDFVTPENLESKISECLDNELNYNFAITPSGEKILSTKPPGNLDAWRGPSPSAYIMGGYKPDSSEWNFIFKNQRTGYENKSKSNKIDNTS